MKTVAGRQDVTSPTLAEIEEQELLRLRRVCEAECERLHRFWAGQYELRRQRLVELGFSSYDEYRRSADYRSRNSFRTAAAGGRCEVCKQPSRMLEVHHRHYETLGNEGRDDLLALCRGCHRAAHEGPALDPTRRRAAVEEGIAASAHVRRPS